MYCILSTGHDSSTVNASAEESCQRRKKRLSWQLYNRASDCWRTVPATVGESCKRIQKHKMDMWYNVNIASALDFQINYYVQYQFHKVLKKLQISFSIDWQNHLRFLLLSLFNRSLSPLYLSPNSLRRSFTNIFHDSYTLILQLFLSGS